jgi:hypothetical protein
MYTEFVVELGEKNHFENQSVNRRIILKCIFGT